jgi:hypothetical protein
MPALIPFLKGDNDQSGKGLILSHRVNQLLRRRLLFQFSLFLP